MGLFDFTKYDKDAPGAAVDEGTRLELRQLASLFLLSSVTLALFILRAFGVALEVTFLPRPVWIAWGVVLLTGWAASYVYGIYVTFQARRWGWLALCAIPVTSEPAAVAYSWIRRGEIEREVVRRASRRASRRRPGGGKQR